MLSDRLINLIETHAETLTRNTLNDLRKSPRTPSYHSLGDDAMRDRIYAVYHELGNWLAEKTDAKIEAWYRELGGRRYREGFALSEVICALMLTKKHLEDYVRNSGLTDSAVDLHRERELFRRVDYFFDGAIYYTALGYEQESSKPIAARRAKAS
jgi:hypothetical protein